jgi:hypothetical protein
MHVWLELHDSNILEAVIEELPEDVGFESTRDNAKSTGSGEKKKVNCRHFGESFTGETGQKVWR